MKRQNVGASLTAKKVAAIICLLPVVWFALDLTGLRFGDCTIVVSCFIDEPIDAVFWAVLLAAWLLFIFAERLGKYALSVCTIIWAGMQLSMYAYSRENITGYNAFFGREGTYYLIAPSEHMLIKDFYHTVLDVLLVAAVTAILVYLGWVMVHAQTRRRGEK